MRAAGRALSRRARAGCELRFLSPSALPLSSASRARAAQHETGVYAPLGVLALGQVSEEGAAWMILGRAAAAFRLAAAAGEGARLG